MRQFPPHQIDLAFHAFYEAGAQLRLERSVISGGGRNCMIEGAGVECHRVGLARQS
jgi:hypothetical protein